MAVPQRDGGAVGLVAAGHVGAQAGSMSLEDGTGVACTAAHHPGGVRADNGHEAAPLRHRHRQGVGARDHPALPEQCPGEPVPDGLDEPLTRAEERQRGLEGLRRQG